MKFSILKENLNSALFIVSHITGKNINLPILNNVMMEAKEGNIKLISTNLEMGIVHSMRGKIEKEGSFTVDSRVIADYVALLPNKKVDVERRESNLVIECENYKTKIKGQPVDEYPLIPSVDRDNFYSAGVGEFKKALAQVVFAVSTSETRLELSGVFFNFRGNKLILAATDSYRLSEREIGLKNGPGEERSIIIPARTLQELIRILSGLKENGDMGGDDEEIKFYISDNQILFTVKSTELISRLIEGQYPDYKQIIPTTPKTTALVNRAELVRAIKASSLFSKTSINDVNLDFPKDKKQMVISSASDQTGESVIKLEANSRGEDNGVVINYRYLLDGLNNIDGENVKIGIIDNNTPCLLQPEGEKDYLYIIMPIKQ
ncbi:MAG: DNA polymerase III subunit beta [Patescibacteria group bacterium]|nr:DNA polymerase III subunit beta [Patescibacteria group bacterium]